MPMLTIKSDILAGVEKPNGVMIGSETAKSLNLRLGSKIIIALAKTKTAGIQASWQKMKNPLRVNIIFITTDPEYEIMVFMPPSTVSSWTPDTPQAIPLEQWQKSDIKSLTLLLESDSDSIAPSTETGRGAE